MRKRALDLLARREHAVAELTRKLIEKGFDEIFVHEALSALVDDGLLSDARYAESYVRSRMGKGFGPVRIREELRQRGVASAVWWQISRRYKGASKAATISAISRFYH